MAGTTINPYRFGGQLGYRRDGANRSYVRARHLDTSRGRWISRDPVSVAEADFNLYCYVRNDPVTDIDPSGLWTIKSLSNGHWICKDRTDKAYVSSALDRTGVARMSICNAFNQCQCKGECIATNGTLYDFGTGCPLGPVHDCKGYKTAGIAIEPHPIRINVSNGQYITGRALFVGKNCNLDDMPSAGGAVGRTAACIKPSGLCIFVTPAMTGRQLCALMRQQCSGGQSVNLDGSGSSQVATSSNGACNKIVPGDARHDNNFIVLCR